MFSRCENLASAILSESVRSFTRGSKHFATNGKKPHDCWNIAAAKETVINSWVWDKSLSLSFHSDSSGILTAFGSFHDTKRI